MAHEYARRKSAYVIESRAQIAGPFERAGFEVTLGDGGLAERQADRPAPTAGFDTYRMRVIATKR